MSGTFVGGRYEAKYFPIIIQIKKQLLSRPLICGGADYTPGLSTGTLRRDCYEWADDDPTEDPDTDGDKGRGRSVGHQMLSVLLKMIFFFFCRWKLFTSASLKTARHKAGTVKINGNKFWVTGKSSCL